MTNGSEATDTIIPKGFRTKLVVVGLVYMFAMIALSGAQSGNHLTDIWFRTALPVSFAGAAVLQWVFAPRPRPKARDVAAKWLSIARRRPGATILSIGLAVLIMGGALIIG